MAPFLNPGQETLVIVALLIVGEELIDEIVMVLEFAVVEVTHPKFEVSIQDI